MTMDRKKKEMDKLSWENAQALAAGMSYGKWKAKQAPVKIEPKPVVPEGWQRCQWCGNPFKAGHGKRFCDNHCREQAYHKRRLELKAEREQWQKECAVT